MIRTIRVLMLAPLVALGCGGPAPYAPAQTPESATSGGGGAGTTAAPADSTAATGQDAPAGEDDIRLRVLDQGSEPRRPLRYKFKVGAVEQMQFDMRMAMTLGAADPG